MTAIMGPNYSIIVQQGAITPGKRLVTTENFSKPQTPKGVTKMPFNRGEHTVHGK